MVDDEPMLKRMVDAHRAQPNSAWLVAHSSVVPNDLWPQMTSLKDKGQVTHAGSLIMLTPAGWDRADTLWPPPLGLWWVDVPDDQPRYSAVVLAHGPKHALLLARSQTADDEEVVWFPPVEIRSIDDCPEAWRDTPPIVGCRTDNTEGLTTRQWLARHAP